jgi:hypothetical protein
MQSLGCLFMGKAVLGINPALGRLVSKEEAHEHIRRCNEKGLFHLIGRNKLDTVWLGIGPVRTCSPYAIVAPAVACGGLCRI